MTETTADESAVTSGGLVVRAVLRTDVGLVRSENQDFGTYTRPDEEQSARPGGRLLIVADGMGGHRGGATASRLSVETVKSQYIGAETDDIPTALREALTRANARIFSEAQANAELRGMGTTTSVLAVRGGRAWFAHVGDSRIYLVREGEISQMTDDHSLVASMVREGLLTSKEAETHPRRNVLQRSMGVAEEVEIDVKGPFDVRRGDTFILCSDGLHGVVKEAELLNIAKLPIEQAADEFVKRALDRGAPDNVTVIVARMEGEDSVDPDLMIGDDDATIVGDVVRPDLGEAEQPPLAGAGASGQTPAASPAPIEGGAGDASSASTPPPVFDDEDPTLRVDSDPAATQVPERRGGGMMKWILIMLLALGVAGALFFRTQNQSAGASPAAPASR